jgi:dTDP-4-amino-4,6-dideoxygalactose transaminase
MKVPLLDLKAQWQTIRAEVEAAIAPVLESQLFIMGPQVRECEEAVARYSGCPHGIGVSSGTDALLLALMVEDVGPGDEVITTPYTFFATAGSIARLGAKPVFVDIDPVTCNIDTTAIERRITRRTRAIIPVHLFGQMADMDPIIEVARRHQLVVIEDAAQAIGAEYRGRRAGSIGDYGCFSFFPSKNLGAFGDAGMIVTNDTVRAEKLAVLRNHGMRPKYYHQLVGGNFRMDTLQAAVVLAKLPHLDAWTAGRQRNAERYRRLFLAAGLAADGASLDERPIQLPDAVQSRHIFNQFVVRCRRRDALRQHLVAAEIGTEVYYPVPLHLQECFRYLDHQTGDLPASEAAANETLALPIFPELTDEQAHFVVQQVGAFYAPGA